MKIKYNILLNKMLRSDIINSQLNVPFTFLILKYDYYLKGESTLFIKENTKIFQMKELSDNRIVLLTYYRYTYYLQIYDLSSKRLFVIINPKMTEVNILYIMKDNKIIVSNNEQLKIFYLDQTKELYSFNVDGIFDINELTRNKILIMTSFGSSAKILTLKNDQLSFMDIDKLCLYPTKIIKNNEIIFMTFSGPLLYNFEGCLERNLLILQFDKTKIIYYQEIALLPNHNIIYIMKVVFIDDSSIRYLIYVDMARRTIIKTIELNNTMKFFNLTTNSNNYISCLGYTKIVQNNTVNVKNRYYISINLNTEEVYSFPLQENKELRFYMDN